MSLIAALIEGVRPPPSLTVSEWADAKVVLTSELAAEPGPFRTSRTPYAKEMMDVLTGPASLIAYRTSAQVGKTTSELCGIGYHIEHDPCPMLMVLPDKEVAETFAKGKLNPFIDGTPVLAERVGLAGSRGLSSTLWRKEFPGGFLSIVGANVPAALAMQSVRIVWGDEVDRFRKSAGKEGDPLFLAYKRSQTFGARRKLVVSSTPTIRKSSRIDELFEQTDQRYFHVPLPCCGTLQKLEWSQVRWKKGRPETAEYECRHCGDRVSGGHIKRAVQDPGASWVALHPERSLDRIGFHIWQIYSPWSTLTEIVQGYEETIGRPDLEKIWVNTVLGESYDATEEIKTTPEAVFNARREIKDGVIPKGACVVTAGVDVQGDRIEVLFCAFGPDKLMWMLKKQVIEGDTTADETWRRLEQVLMRRWPHETHPQITRPVEGVAIDSGYLTQRVYDFGARAFRLGRPWYPVKGMDGEGRIAWEVSQRRLKSGAKLHLVGVDSLKTEVHARLGNEDAALNTIIIRKDDCFSLETIEQLFAEQVTMVINTKGFSKREWHKVPGRPNELLDMAVYAEAVHRSLNIDHKGRLDGMKRSAKLTMSGLASMFDG